MKFPALICLLLFNSQNLYSLQQIKFKHLDVKDGLSQNWVRCIHQDKYGYLWFGTGSGVSKYNGCNFQIYTKIYTNSKTGLTNNFVNKIFETENGTLWIGTQSGIDIYNRAQDKFIQYPAMQQEYINDFLEIDSNRMLVACYSGLSLIYKTAQSEHVNDSLTELARKFPRISVSTMLRDDNGLLWFGTFNGLYLMDVKNNELINFKLDNHNADEISNNGIYSLYQDSNGRLWCGTSTNGLMLMKYNPAQPRDAQFITYKNDPADEITISKGSILALLDDQEGNLWIGVENGGLNRLDLRNFNENHCVFTRYFQNPADNYSISSNSIYSLFKDKDGTIWVGTYGDGINYYNKVFTKFSHIYHVPNTNSGLSHNAVNVIFEDGDNLLIGTEDGLDIINSKTNTHKHLRHDPYNPNSLGSNAIMTICRDSLGNRWIGTWAGGLNLFNEKSNTFTRYLHDDGDETSLGNNSIFSIICDSHGRLWIATMGGGLNLFDYKTKSFKRFTTDFLSPNAISGNWIRAVMESSTGEIWLSTTTAVDIFNYEKQKFTHFTYDTTDINSISYNGAIVIFEDSKQNVWIGSEGGLNVFNRKDSSFTRYLQEDGLPNNTIRAICEDDHGNLWISTNNGISKFQDAVDRPKAPVFINYGVDDGLQGNEFNRRASCKGRDGRIYFGGNNGFNVFHPDSIRDNTLIPNAVLTNFLINNLPVEIGAPDSPLQQHISMVDEIKLNHYQSVFSIEYAILNYLSPNNNQYAFKLDGFEKNWNYVGNRCQATYTNLDPGVYTFRVKGTNNDNVWNETGASVKIFIIPPWWKTAWAYGMYFLLAGCVLFIIWKFQLHKAAMKHELMLEQHHAEKLEEIDRMKSRFFSNITHEFRTPLTLIMGPVKQFLSGEKIDNFNEKCEMVLRNSEKLYRLVNQLLELSKLESGHVALHACKENILPLVEKIVLSFEPLAESKMIDLQFCVLDNFNGNDQAIEIYIDHDKIDKIFSNLLSNALKFTPELGHVIVSIQTCHNSNGSFELADEQKQSHNIRNVIQWIKEFGQRHDDSLLNSEDVNHRLIHTNKHGYVEIIVKDNGVGIPAHDVEKIFDRFYQVADSRLGTHESTGIGLALTKELVELHGGTIHVETEYEHGTAFVVRLPLGKDHLNASQISEILPEKHPPQTDDNLAYNKHTRTLKIVNSLNEQKPAAQENVPIILIVDDNDDVLKYLSDNLSQDYRIVTAKDGLEGISKAINQVPDLIISDVVMPKMDGFALCSKIKSDELTNHIPIILLSVRASDEHKIEGLETGADDYMTKPFDIRELQVRIRNLIDQRRQLKKKFNRKGGLKPTEITTSSMDERFLNKALSIIEANMSDPEFGVEEFAREMSLSRVQLYRKIRVITGQTATEFIRSVRLNRAAQLLRQKHDNISQVAYDVGFHSPSYFSKSFFKQFGVYPSDYVEHSA
ncbi:response regulator [candidate division KSB1 bacterium]|nr:response regulator [candidate division KSB1 bacterium]